MAIQRDLSWQLLDPVGIDVEFPINDVMIRKTWNDLISGHEMRAVGTGKVQYVAKLRWLHNHLLQSMVMKEVHELAVEVCGGRGVGSPVSESWMASPSQGSSCLLQ